MSAPANRLLLVDGHAQAYRAFHAIRNLRGPEGAPTNAIFGFIKILTKLRERLTPDYLQVVWDGGMAAERLAALPEYKAQRPPMPDDLGCQLDELFAYLAAAGIASYCQAGVEADDWIATAARQAVAQGAQVVIASPDKDFMQLVSPQVGLVNPNDPESGIWGVREVEEKTGVRPDQIVDWLSLIGDSVDNIPGVPGVGPKTATRLLRQYGAIPAIYERLNDLESDKLRAAMVAADGVMRRNQALIRLKDQLPGAVALADLRPGTPDIPRLRELFARWGFRSMLEALGPAGGRQAELF